MHPMNIVMKQKKSNKQCEQQQLNHKKIINELFKVLTVTIFKVIPEIEVVFDERWDSKYNSHRILHKMSLDSLEESRASFDLVDNDSRSKIMQMFVVKVY